MITGTIESKFVVCTMNIEPTTIRSIMNPIPHNWNIGEGFTMT